MSGPEQHVKDFGTYLAGLDDEARKQALAQAKVLATAQAPDETIGQPPVRSIKAYLDEKIPEPPSLVKADVIEDLPPTGQVVRGAMTLTTSPGGKGKTVLSLNRLARWAAGLPLFEGLDDCQVPTQPLRSIVIENEGAAGFFQSRLQRLCDGLEYDRDEQKMLDENMMIWGDGGWSSMKLDDGENLDLVRRACEKYEPDILFMEPLRGLHTGDENNNSEMAVVMDALNGLASTYKCAIMLTHHERKSGAQAGEDEMFAVRGGAVFTDLAGVVERFRAVKAGQLREVSWTKSRFGPAYGPIRMHFDPVRWRYSYVSLNDIEQGVLNVLEENPGDWYGVSEVAELTAETEDVARKTLNALAKDGRIKKIKNPLEGGGFKYRSNTGEANGGMALD